MTLAAELEAIRERDRRDHRMMSVWDTRSQEALAVQDRARLLDAAEAVMREVEYAPESNDYLEDWERGHRAALIEIGRVVTTALEGK